MNTGIIMIGLSLVLLSVGLVSSPASAAFPDGGCGSAVMAPCFPYGTTITSSGDTSATPDCTITSAGTRTYDRGMPDNS